MKRILLAFSIPFLALAFAGAFDMKSVSQKAAPALLREGKKEFVGVLVNPPPAIVEVVSESLKRGARADLICVGLTCSPLSALGGVLAIVDQGGDSTPGGAVVVDDAFILVLDPQGWYKGSGWALGDVKRALEKTVRDAKGRYAEYMWSKRGLGRPWWRLW